MNKMISNHKTRFAGWIGCLAMAMALSVSAQEEGEASAVPTIGIDEVSRGQTGYGLSVFAGTEPERFDVEVLGVLRNSTAELSYILARLSGQDLERSGVIAGMSGSPVYFDERLAGAVAFSYQFGLDAIAGITPIDAMRQLSDLPVAPVRQVSAPSGLDIDLDDLIERDFSLDLLKLGIEGLQPASYGGGRSAVQWTSSGFGEAAKALLERSLGPLNPAGASLAASGGSPMVGGSGGVSSSAASDLGPGSAVAAVLVSGDLSLAAHGTVTDRIGDEILAFGHPVFSLGPINLPLASGEVITIIANAANSFKVSNAGEVIGAFDEDRQAGARGRLGASAPTTPLDIRLRGLTTRDYHMEVSNLRQMRPILMAVSTLGALDSGSYAGGFQGIDLDALIVLKGFEDLRIRQSFDGDQAGIGSIVHLLGFAAFLDFNTLADVEIERVEVELTQVDRPHSSTLVAAYPKRTRCEPGQTVPVTLEFQAVRGERYRREIEIEVPANLPSGRFTVVIGDGSSMDAVRLSLERREPTNFEQALDLMQSFRSRRELVIYGLRPASGLAVAGEALPNLPGSMRSIFAAGSISAGAPLGHEIAYQKSELLDRPIDGAVRLDLEVRRRPR